MKYVKILFAIALVFTMCSAFSLKKITLNLFMLLGFLLRLQIPLYISQKFRSWIV